MPIAPQDRERQDRVDSRTRPIDALEADITTATTGSRWQSSAGSFSRSRRRTQQRPSYKRSSRSRVVSARRPPTMLVFSGHEKSEEPLGARDARTSGAVDGPGALDPRGCGVIAHSARDFVARLHDDGPPLVCGIVNVTPDSFSDGGRFHATCDAVTYALRLVREGADMIMLAANQRVRDRGALVRPRRSTASRRSPPNSSLAPRARYRWTPRGQA